MGDGSRRYLYAHDREQLVSKVHGERGRVARVIPVKAKGLALRNYAEQWLAGRHHQLSAGAASSTRVHRDTCSRTLWWSSTMYSRRGSG